MRIKSILFSAIILGVAAAVAFAAIFVDSFTDYDIYSSPFIIAALALLGLATLLACFRKKYLSFKGIGFLICHLAVVMLFIAAFVGFVWGQSGQMTLYSGGYGSRTVYAQEKGEEYYFELPFTVGISDFTVTYEPYKYVYSVVENGEFTEKGKAELTEDGLDCGKYGVIPISAFLSDGMLKTQVQYQSMLATWNGKTPEISGYNASIVFSDENAALPLTINHPVTHGGYKFYLMSYNAQGSESGMDYLVALKVKRDPAIGFAIAAFILCPIGTFLLCLRPLKKRAQSETEVSGDE